MRTRHEHRSPLDEAVDRARRYCTVVGVDDGMFIHREGQWTRWVYLVVRGTALVEKEGRAATLASTGTWILDACRGRRAASTVVAAGGLHVAVIDVTDLDAALEALAISA